MPSWGFLDKDNLGTYARTYAILGVERAESYARYLAKEKRAVDLEGRTAVAELHRELYQLEVRDDSNAQNPDATSWEFCKVSSQGATYWMLCKDLGHGYGYGKAQF